MDIDKLVAEKVKLALEQQEKQQKEKERRNANKSEKRRKTGLIDLQKSPSDTTLYAPGLKRLSLPGNEVVKNMLPNFDHVDGNMR